MVPENFRVRETQGHHVVWRKGSQCVRAAAVWCGADQATGLTFHSAKKEKMFYCNYKTSLGKQNLMQIRQTVGE